ncbi:hypothetical protein PR001_g11834 [Phytophthora rubi]|uniref:Uncharacterized protein n=1 Tax=Phytophthora rubi TaxID=129364 RepID=A0A6A3KHI3_9STRA|nr:hypothetical protein PR002_g16458 [Phytophthora rubi]KAE9028003.1 hypothetical protein PR001_g11834 [Phytophthora rubi]
MAKKKMTTGSGGKQRSVKGRDDEDSAAVAHSSAAGVASAEGTPSQPDHEARPGSSPPAPTATAAQQQQAAHARSVKAQKLLRRREVLELRQRQAAHARLFKRPKQVTQPDN